VRLREQDYLAGLERFIGAVGLPPHHMQSVLLGELFRVLRGDKSFLVTAQLADALFGLSAVARPAAALRRWAWLPFATRSVRLPASLKPAKLRTAELWLSLVEAPVRSVRGLAARAATYTDFDFLAKVFGAAEVERRLAARLEYVLELCPFLSPDASGIDAQLEAAHLVDYFCDDALSIWRQAAMSHSGYLIGPFTHPKIVSASLRFRRRDRYWRNGETKPALKSVLRRRLPEYDTHLPKLSFGLPLQRFLESGPLHDTPYFVPEKFLPGQTGSDPRTYPPWIVWSILTLSVWREMVSRGQAAPPCSFSRRLT
jgi:asparagine synthase (glutamine-hydrolysing)